MVASRRARSDELSLPGPTATFATRGLSADDQASQYGTAARGGKAAQQFRKAILLDNGVVLKVQGPSETTADRGVGVEYV
jgi:hypothetical protein